MSAYQSLRTLTVLTGRAIASIILFAMSVAWFAVVFTRSPSALLVAVVLTLLSLTFLVPAMVIAAWRMR